jgi:hypothetical protein
MSGSQVWSMEKLENKLIDMREMYQCQMTQDYKDRPMVNITQKKKYTFDFIKVNGIGSIKIQRDRIH